MTDVDRAAPVLALAVDAPEADVAGLVRRAQARDTAAFEQLYRLHVGRIHAVCLRMTANPRQAEELTQRTFLVTWQKLPAFRAESAFASWLHRIAVNTVLVELRADHRRQQRVFASDDPALLEVAALPVPAGIRLDLEQAIAALPPQARAVFVLHDVEGWQHDEIAAELGVTAGTSKAHLHRARKLLQEALR